MRIETHEQNRKLLAQAVGEVLGIEPRYERTPTYAYTIGAVTIDRGGVLICEDADVWATLMPLLTNHGWQEEARRELESHLAVLPTEAAAPDETDSEAKTEEPTETAINTYMANSTVQTVSNLIRVMYSKQKLINRMLQMENLRIEGEVVTALDETRFHCVSDLETTLHDLAERGCMTGLFIEGGRITVTIPFHADTPTRWHDYAILFEAIVKQVQTASRVKTEILEPDGNEKYHANAWLNRLGFGGADYKDLRHTLMAHLTGYAAFRSDEKMQQHKDRLAEQRRIAREINAEADHAE